MKYIITGTFLIGGSWEEDAENKRELEFVLHKIFTNDTVNKGSVRITNKKNEDITDITIAKIYGEEEIW